MSDFREDSEKLTNADKWGVFVFVWLGFTLALFFLDVFGH